MIFTTFCEESLCVGKYHSSNFMKQADSKKYRGIFWKM